VGVLGADSVGGARLERIRIGTFVGGSVVRSIADAGRIGGASGGVDEDGGLDPLIPGEAVCALDGALEGGGGGVAGFAASAAPAFLLTHFLRSLS